MFEFSDYECKDFFVPRNVYNVCLEDECFQAYYDSYDKCIVGNYNTYGKHIEAKIDTNFLITACPKSGGKCLHDSLAGEPSITDHCQKIKFTTKGGSDITVTKKVHAN